MEYKPSYTDGLYLMHHGIKGQKWGVRRYQNPDGSLTAEGRKRIISAHEKRGRAIGKLSGRIGGYFLYDNSDAIASKSKEVAKRAGNSTVASKTKETAKRIGESRPVSKVSEAAKTTGKKVSDKLDNDTTKKIRDKTGNAISSGKESLKRSANEAKELKKAIDNDPVGHYRMSTLASDIGGAVGERIGAAAGRKIGEASASIQSAYGKHKMKQLMKKNRRIKHADIYGDYLAHHGILGMHWGVRRFEDKSGHLTPAGKKRYDKYDYSNTPSTNRKKSSKKDLTTGQKLALGAGVALTAYGATKIYKGRKTLDGMKDQIASTHASELEGLDSKKKNKILKRVAKEQIYEANRIKQLEKSKDPNAQRKIKSASSMLTDEHISNRINKLKPKNLRTKESKQNNNPKQVDSKPKQISDETAAIYNANRMATYGLSLPDSHKSNMSSSRVKSSSKKPIAVTTRTESKKPTVTRTESKPKKSIFNRKEKQDKPKKKSDPIATAMTAKKVFDTVGAVKNRDYGQAIYNVGTEIVNATDRRIKENRRNKSK